MDKYFINIFVLLLLFLFRFVNSTTPINSNRETTFLKVTGTSFYTITRNIWWRAVTEDPSAGNVIFVERGVVPYHVSLQHITEESEGVKVHFCSGALIDEYFVITSAECIRYHRLHTRNKSKIFITAGASNLHDLKHDIERQETEIILYPEYNENTGSNNIALIKVDKKYDFNVDLAVQQVIFRRKKVKKYRNCVLSSFIYKGGPEGYSLFRLAMFNATIQHESFCHHIPNFDDETLYCVTMYNHSVINIDSGAPLVCEGVLAGIAREPFPILGKNDSLVFTNVFYYFDWVDTWMLISSSNSIHFSNFYFVALIHIFLFHVFVFPFYFLV